MPLLVALPATLASYTTRSSASQCTFELSKVQCQAYRTATPYYTDSRGFSIGGAPESATFIGGIGNFDVSDRYLPHGCQWYVDPKNPEHNRFLFNDENADAPEFSNERDTVNEECTGFNSWCYPTYSHRVCAGNGLPPPSFPLPPPLPVPPHPHGH